VKEQLKLVLDLSTALLTRAKTPKKPTPPDDTEQIDTSSTKKPPAPAGRLAKEETKSSGTLVAVVDDGGKLEDLKDRATSNGIPYEDSIISVTAHTEVLVPAM
jgi:hypothetical protein